VSDSTVRALLICAHALRLNTTLPQSDQEWPTDPWAVMREVRAALLSLSPVETGVCAAIVVLDEANEDPLFVDQDELLSRLSRLTSASQQQPSPSGL
jgi:hypothetical protein